MQGLQWVLSGYLVTYGGLLLLGGLAGDLLGRRRLLVAGTALFAACSLAGGLATGAGMLVGGRLGQGAGAAMMAPAGLSILTTSFTGGDRHRALGVCAAISGLAAAAGVFLGGVLSQGPGWRWVLFVNLPVCVLILFGAFRLVPGGRPAARQAGFAGAALTAGFHRALIACAVFLLAAAIIALRATNSRGEPVTQPSSAPPHATRPPRRLSWPTRGRATGKKNHSHSEVGRRQGRTALYEETTMSSGPRMIGILRLTPAATLLVRAASCLRTPHPFCVPPGVFLGRI